MKKIIIVLLIMSAFANATAVKEFYRNGNIKSVIIYDVNATFNCIVKIYYRNGKVKEEAAYDATSKSTCNFSKLF